VASDLAIAIGAAATLVTACAHAFVLISKELRAWHLVKGRRIQRSADKNIR
jgi:hypothetical protein